MHGMVSLAVLVAAFAGLAGWIGYLLARLYLACPAARLTPARSTAGPADPALAAGPAGSPPAGDPAVSPSGSDPAASPSGGDPAGEHAATREPVA
jgi:hypothetical protein